MTLTTIAELAAEAETDPREAGRRLLLITRSYMGGDRPAVAPIIERMVTGPDPRGIDGLLHFESEGRELRVQTEHGTVWLVPQRTGEEREPAGVEVSMRGFCRLVAGVRAALQEAKHG